MMSCREVKERMWRWMERGRERKVEDDIQEERLGKRGGRHRIWKNKGSEMITSD